MNVGVKICGINNESSLKTAISEGADYVGLVLYSPSPRAVSLDKATQLANFLRANRNHTINRPEHTPQQLKLVTLIVDESDENIEAIISAIDPDYLQLHGKETPARVKAISEVFNRPLIKAIAIESCRDIEKAEAYRPFSKHLLFDAKPDPSIHNLPGGNGLSFDWKLLKNVAPKSYWLAGGLTPQNIEAALSLTQPEVVDVSSGVEHQPGVKDNEKIIQFIHRAKAISEEKL